MLLHPSRDLFSPPYSAPESVSWHCPGEDSNYSTGLESLKFDFQKRPKHHPNSKLLHDLGALTSISSPTHPSSASLSFLTCVSSATHFLYLWDTIAACFLWLIMAFHLKQTCRYNDRINGRPTWYIWYQDVLVPSFSRRYYLKLGS